MMTEVATKKLVHKTRLMPMHIEKHLRDNNYDWKFISL